jgi:Flp pilus assembly protein TadG
MNPINFRFITQFWRDTKGLAFVESALLLPIMIALLFGMFDIGQAIIINQKVTAASHMAGDLITRKTVINDADLDDAVGVALLVIDPYDRSLLGVDIVGITFDEDDDPEETWRHTVNMDENVNLPARADGLGVNGEGLVAISTVYTYTPYFSGILSGDITMEETSFLRGRKNSFVRYEDD